MIEVALTKRIIELAVVHGRYGTPRITALLHWKRWRVNHKRVERIWRMEGSKSTCPLWEELGRYVFDELSDDPGEVWARPSEPLPTAVSPLAPEFAL